MRKLIIFCLVVSAFTITGISQNKSSAGATESPAIAEVVTRPEHPATEAQIREYFALTGALRTMRELMSKMIAAQRITGAPYYPSAFWDDMQAEFLKIDLADKLIPIYQQFLSTEDMAEIISFYRSPAGKRILATQLPITQQSQTIFRELGREIGEKVYTAHKDEIDAAKKKYEATPTGK